MLKSNKDSFEALFEDEVLRNFQSFQHIGCIIGWLSGIFHGYIMSIQKPILAVFPYLQIVEPLKIRDEFLFPSTFLSLTPEKIDETDDWFTEGKKAQRNYTKSKLAEGFGFEQSFFDEAAEILSEVKEFFYWYTNEKISDLVWSYLPGSSNLDRADLFNTHLEEIRRIFGYLWCIPDARPNYFSLQGHYEQADYFTFLPESSIWIGRIRCIQILPVEFDTDDTFDGYIHFLNGNRQGDIMKGCRIYPSSKLVFHRRGYLLGDMLRDIEQKRLQTNVDLLFDSSKALNLQVLKILDAIEWFNRSCSGENTQDISLVYLAIAFETLLIPTKAEAKSNLPKQLFLKYTIITLLGNIERLDEWIEQFYNARSRILHEGKWSHMHFMPKIRIKDESASTYGELIHQGWLIFRACANAVLAGAQFASSLHVGSSFFKTSELLQQILETLDRKQSPFKCLDELSEQIKNLANTDMLAYDDFEIELLWEIASKLAKFLVDFVHDVGLRQKLEQITSFSEPENFDNASNILRYTKVLFQNLAQDQLPEQVIQVALQDLNSASPPSLQIIRGKIEQIIERNDVTGEFKVGLNNVARLIDTSIAHHRLLLFINSEVYNPESVSFANFGVTSHHPYTLIEGFASFVKYILHEVERNVELHILGFLVEMDRRSVE